MVIKNPYRSGIRWESFPVEFKDGLVTNMSPLQQGVNKAGSARVLKNFEPSIEGGYRRVQGYSKYDPNYVPLYGQPKVQGSGQSGFTIQVANLFSSPSDGDTFSITGVVGTFTVSTGGVTYNSVDKTATLTIMTTLPTSPSDQADVTFQNNTTQLIEGLYFFGTFPIAYRTGALYTSNLSGWTKVSVPNYGIVKVNGAAQIGSNLAIDGLTEAPRVGTTFTISGVEKVYTVLVEPTIVGTGATVSVSPSLSSSPLDNASISFLNHNRQYSGKHRFTEYSFTGTTSVMIVDGVHSPARFSSGNLTELAGVPNDVEAADHVVEFHNHIFFVKGSVLTFTAPYTDSDFTAGNGSGSIQLSYDITGIIVFRNKLIVFCKDKIFQVTGTSLADFSAVSITDDIGCVEPDSIQEVGGDIMFLGPDGLRLLSATARIGDFGLQVASRPIQDLVQDFLASHTSFVSCVIRGKSQYRLFGFNQSDVASSSNGVLATQFADQTSSGMAWAELKGFLVNVVSSRYTSTGEVIVFANKDGFVYSMESGNSLDGANIEASFYTPYFIINDPRLRKTIYRLNTYIDPTGSVSGGATLKFDYDAPNLVQPTPSSVNITNVSGVASYYGTGTYGSSVYNGKLVSVFSRQTVGSGFSVSIQYQFDGTDPPFSLDSLTLEYDTYDRN